MEQCTFIGDSSDYVTVVYQRLGLELITSVYLPVDLTTIKMFILHGV